MNENGSPLTRRAVLTAGAVAAGAFLAACSGAARRPLSAPTPTRSRAPAPSGRPSPTTKSRVDPASVHANEIGVIPVLMHHRLVDHVDSEYDMTPAWLRTELERLLREGYFPVTMLQVARGDLGHVPAGRSPVVLTFDDSSRGQLHYSAAGQVAADSAVGMLVDFAKEHPDFPAVASFYLNKDPFALGDPQRALGDLHRLGFEIGNHTYDHVPLDIGPSNVERELGALAAMVTTALPGVAPRTLALPLGVEPSHPAVVRQGSWQSTTYVNEAVLLVGAEPAHSPFHREWNPGAVPRIRSSSYAGGKGQFLSTWWLDQIASGQVTRYVSAGNPGQVTVPKKYAGHVAPTYRSRLITY